MSAPVPFTPGLHKLAEGTYAYLSPNGSWGRSNAGVITADQDVLLVDTQYTLALTQTLLTAISVALPSAVVSTVVNTHANGDHCWGNQLVPNAEIIASDAAAAAMPHDFPPHLMRQLMADHDPDSALGAYTRLFFGDFDFDGVAVTAPTRTFRGALDLTVGDSRRVHLIEVGPAHTDGDVIANVPDVAVVFAGDILFVGDHPVMWSGPAEHWVAACDRILNTNATLIVPGHGPVTDRAGMRLFRDYLAYIAVEAERRYRRGMPYWVAAMDIPVENYADWGHRERLVVTVATIYRHLGESAEPVNVQLGRMATAYFQQP